MTIVAAAIIAVTVVAVIPGAGTDEDAAGEVIGSVVTVRSAGIGIVAVVSIRADWRWADGAVDRTYSDAHGNLRVGAARGKKQNSQQCNIF
jgi:hypothetical protein